MWIPDLFSFKDIKTPRECEDLQDEILATLIQQLPTHVAGFGNTDTTKIDDWVMIINDRPTPQVFIIFLESEILLKESWRYLKEVISEMNSEIF